jgi:hypothetical protein
MIASVALGVAQGRWTTSWPSRPPRCRCWPTRPLATNPHFQYELATADNEGAAQVLGRQVSRRRQVVSCPVW